MKRTALPLLVLAPLMGCQHHIPTPPPSSLSPSPTPSPSMRATPVGGVPGKALPLERIFADPPMAGALAQRVRFFRGGKDLVMLRPNEQNSEVLDLWRMDAKSGKTSVLVRTSDLVAVGKIKLSAAERMARERKRVRHRGITSYQSCGSEQNSLLFPLSGSLYAVDIAGSGPKVKKLNLSGRGKAAKGAPLDPSCSPKGRFVTFVRKNTLFVHERAKGRTTAVSQKGKGAVSYGLSEFVAQEEMGRFRGYAWNDSERYLAYLKVDESKVALKTRAKIYANRTALTKQRYPAAGEANAEVSVLVWDSKTKGSRPAKLPKALAKQDGYIARFGFVPKTGQLYVQWQSRDQSKLVLLLSEKGKPSGPLKEVLVEEDKAWVAIHDDLQFIGDKGEFLWTSERSGQNQLYVMNASGKVVRQLSQGKGPVVDLIGVDEDDGIAYYHQQSRRSLGQVVMAAPIGGGTPRVVGGPGGYHHAVFGDAGFLLEKVSSYGQPPEWRLLEKETGKTRVLPRKVQPAYASYARSKPIFGVAKASDGTELNTLLLPPTVRQPGQKYPVVVYVYGGPHAQVVTDRWSRNLPWFTYLNQQGFGVFSVDNRGSGGRERRFTRAIKNRFGDIELKDLTAAVKQMTAQTPWVNQERLGVFGWSYGGYLSSLAISAEKTPFRACASVAPVSDWKLYDTHYTERYIGTPQGNKQVYTKSDLLPRMARLKDPQRHYLLLHGMADDNVLFEHSLRLVQELQKQGVVFQFMAYPGRAHGLRGRATRLHVFRTISQFFERTLKAPQGAGATREPRPAIVPVRQAAKPKE